MQVDFYTSTRTPVDQRDPRHRAADSSKAAGGCWSYQRRCSTATGPDRSAALWTWRSLTASCAHDKAGAGE
jgi:hypothetical protein